MIRLIERKVWPPKRWEGPKHKAGSKYLCYRAWRIRRYDRMQARRSPFMLALPPELWRYR